MSLPLIKLVTGFVRKRFRVILTWVIFEGRKDEILRNLSYGERAINSGHEQFIKTVF